MVTRSEEFDWAGFVDDKRFIVIVRGDDSHIALHGGDGKPVERLTRRSVRPSELVTVDTHSKWIYFTGRTADSAETGNQLYRVNFQGEMFSRLTDDLGDHDIVFAPSKQYFLDTHSSLKTAPVVDLRHADGTLLRNIAKANIIGLEELKWTSPEPFVVKSADGKTDLFGVLYKPYDFDANKKYAVIDCVGPSGTPRNRFVDPYFSLGIEAQALAQLGFITINVDTRRTIGEAGRKETADRVAALEQLAETHSFMDLSRVGVKGGSILGYYALHAMLTAPDVYDVCVVSAPISDLGDHISNQWRIGLPRAGNDQVYDYVSHYRRAGSLKGKLLLVHGTSDQGVPFFQTMKMVDALNQAGKVFELMVLPGQGHRSDEVYDNWRIRRFFVQNLKP